ncbi:MAG: hypothetical protein WDN67_00670 [Candidatus Moraniibacteriota bacterium]
MRVVRQDDSLVKKEEKAQREANARDRYIDSLVNSPRFQKYVIQEIFEKKLEEIKASVFDVQSDDNAAMANALRLAQLNVVSIQTLIGPLRK